MSGERIIGIDARSPVMAQVYALRHAVFVLEQAVPPDLERDDADATAVHVVALRGDAVVGTLRILLDGSRARIGRMAVAASDRRTGIGSRLMRSAEAIVCERGVRVLHLHAQLSAVPFYRRLGFVAEGGEFEEAGIRHVAMRKALA